MRNRKGIVSRVQEEKAGWNQSEIDAWIERKTSQLRDTFPELSCFLQECQRQVFYHACSRAREDSGETACPAETLQRFVLQKLLEVAEIFQAGDEIEELERLWKE